jgi:hypothetical protein
MWRRSVVLGAVLAVLSHELDRAGHEPVWSFLLFAVLRLRGELTGSRL